MTIGERIKFYRVKCGFTQQELADRSKLANKASICNIEKGITDPPASTLARIASALNVEPTALFFDPDTQKSSEFLPYLENADSLTLDMVRRILGMPAK